MLTRQFFNTFTLSLVMLCYSTVKGLANDLVIELGNPQQPGNDTFIVTETNGQTARVTIPVRLNDNGADKAMFLEIALTRLFGFNAKANGNRVTISSPKSLTLTTLINSGQITKGTIINPIATTTPPYTGSIDYHGMLSGLALNGSESTFQSSFGFNGFLAEGNLTYSSLSNPTVDGLLTDMFIDLRSDIPIQLQPNLGLDLENDLITFNFPDDAVNPFVQNFTSDTSTEATLGLTTSVPEPSFPLSLLALGTLGAGATLKRKLKSSKSSEKETTKVS